MSLRKDTYQLRVEILTEDSKKLAKINEETRALEKELKEAKRRGEGVEEVLGKMAKAGKKAGEIDLSKVAKPQLVTRARALQRQMDLIPQSAPAYKKLQGELKGVNDRLATIRTASRGVADTGEAATGALGKMGKAGKAMMALGWTAVLALVAGVAMKFKGLVGELSTMGPELDRMDNKASKVFGDMESYVAGFAETNAEALGLSKRAFEDMTASNSAALQSLGFTTDQGAELGVAMSNLGGIVAEFSGAQIDAADSTERIRKALAGEYDGLDAVNIKLSDSIVQGKLKERGLDKLTGKQLDQAKALAALEGIQERAKLQTELFGESQDSSARAIARNQAQIQEQREELGQKSLPIILAGKKLFFQFTNAVMGLVGGFFDYLTTLKKAAEGSQTFQTVVGTVIGAVIGSFKSLLSIAGGLGNALVKLFEGDFKGAFSAANKGFVDGGKAMVESIKTGYEDGISGFDFELPEPKEFQQQEVDYDAQYASILKAQEAADKLNTEQREKVAKAAAKAREAEFKAALAAEADHFAERKLLAEAEFFGRLTTKEQRDAEIIAAERDHLKNKLAVLAEYGDLEGQKIQEIHTRLAEIQYDEEERVAEMRKERREKDLADQLAAFDAATDDELDQLREAAAEKEITRDELAIASAELERERLEAKLVWLEETGQLETTIAESVRDRLVAIKLAGIATEEAAEKKAAADKIARENAAATAAQQRDEAVKASTNAVVGDVIKMLGKDEAARKKNAAAIKALQLAQIGANLGIELSNIAVAGAKMNAALPGSGIAFQIAKSIAAVVRAGINVSKVRKAERGGLFSAARGMKQVIAGGNRHSAGGTMLYGDDGSVLNVERDELLTVVNRRSTGLLRTLSNLNSHNGWGIQFGAAGAPSRFEQGGIASFNTTPTADVVSGASGGSQDLTGIDARLDRLLSMQELMAQRPIKTYVVVDEFEEKQNDRNYVSERAAL